MMAELHFHMDHADEITTQIAKAFSGMALVL